MNNIKTALVATLVAVFCFAVGFGGGAGLALIYNGAGEPAQVRGTGGLIHNVQESFDEGIAVDGTEVVNGSGSWVGAIAGTTFTGTTGSFSSTLSVTGAVTFTGATDVSIFTQGGGCLATSTSGSATTLTEATMLAYNCIEMTSNLANFTYTLPASSTWTSLLPTVGDRREWLIHNATSTAAITLTIAAGTGIDLMAYTNADDVIDGTEVSRLDCWRKTSTDIMCIVEELLNAE